MTEENRQRIIRQYRSGTALKIIAERFGLTIDQVSVIARKAGCEPRSVHNPQAMVVRVRPSLYERLRKAAKDQRTSPEVLAREAIAAYLGADQ